jgi:hypothetical protein
MSEKTDHTPGPWIVGREFGTVCDGAEKDYVLARCHENSSDKIRANVAYIVRACNSFPALVEALKAFVSAADHAAAGQPLALYRAKELALLADALTKAGE